MLIAADAVLEVTGDPAIDLVLYGNTGDVLVVNRGTIKVRMDSGGGMGIRAHSRGAGNARSINYGTIEIAGAPGSNGRAVLAGIGNLSEPHTTAHVGEAINMPGGRIIVTGADNGRVDGLHVERPAAGICRA